jgi:hypothetical protein
MDDGRQMTDDSHHHHHTQDREKMLPSPAVANRPRCFDIGGMYWNKVASGDVVVRGSRQDDWTRASEGKRSGLDSTILQYSLYSVNG